VRISLGLLRREMAASNASRFLVDGFPRNFDNVKVRPVLYVPSPYSTVLPHRRCPLSHKHLRNRGGRM
jgi:hypothetical protein